MSKFDPSNPTLGDYIRTNPTFSLGLIQGVNGQRKNLSTEMLEAHDEARVAAIENYINNIPLSHEEALELISEDSSLHQTQQGWLRKALAAFIDGEKNKPHARASIAADLIAQREGIDLENKKIDFALAQQDAVLQAAIDLNREQIDLRIAEAIANEILAIANMEETEAKSERINTFVEATKVGCLGDIVTSLDAATASDSIDHQDDPAVKSIREKLEASQSVLSDEQLKPNGVELKTRPLTVVTSEGESLDAVFYGQISEPQAKNLSFTPNQDLTAVTMEIVDRRKINIHTEHTMASKLFSKSAANPTESKPSMFGKLLNKFKKEEPQAELSWQEQDYNWGEPDEHANTVNTKAISAITFADNKQNPIFTHKPKNGAVLFTKGRVISNDDAKLMVAQFLKTNKSGQMFITPPKHLETKEQTRNHVLLIAKNAVELGIPPENIQISPNKMIDSKTIEQIVHEVTYGQERDAANEFGGLHGEFIGETVELEQEMSEEMGIKRKEEPANEPVPALEMEDPLPDADFPDFEPEGMPTQPVNYSPELDEDGDQIPWDPSMDDEPEEPESKPKAKGMKP